jgi:hypothetical protein
MSENLAPLRLSELKATLRARHAGPQGHLQRSVSWVLVDSEDMVLWVEEWRQVARARLNELFDEDASAVERLQLRLLVDGAEERCDWPRRGTPRERALSLVRHLNGHDIWDSDALATTVRNHYLRGTPATVEVDGAALPGLWLTWLSARERVPVGMAVCLGSRRWVLLADERTPALSDTEALGRLTEGVTAFSGEEVTAAAVQDILDRKPAGLTPASRLLARLAVNVAQRLGAFPGEWSEMRGRDADE